LGQSSTRELERRATRPVRVGPVTVGGGAPVSVQSMTKTHTRDAAATLKQIDELAQAGCEIVRCGVPDRRAAAALRQITARSPLPVVADVHFDHRLALMAVEAGAAGVRINPGNMQDRAGLRRLYRAAGEAGVKVRIGVNSGSILPRRGMEVQADGAPPDLAELMVRRALDYCAEAEGEGFGQLVLSLKASDVPTTIRAYRMAAGLCDYPFHVGVTAAGPPRRSLVKSAVGIGTLLAEGIGDTIRVSMTGPPVEEVRAGIAILEALGLREPRRAEVISCPTCARCDIDLVGLVEEVERRVAELSEGGALTAGLKIAVMGCVVNGPGEAAEADVGVAGGRGFGYLFRAGRKVARLDASELADALLAEVRALSERRDEPDGVGR